MKRKSIYLWSMLTAALAVTSCTNSDLPGTEEEDGPKGEVKLEINFSQSTTQGASQRAARPTPVTSWANINSIQFFFYDATSKIIKSSKIVTPGAMSAGTTTKTVTYTDLPVGTYTIAAVANTTAAATFDTYIGATQSVWTEFGVRQKPITNMVIKHKPGTFAGFADPAESTHPTPNTANTAFVEPSEVFVGYATATVVANVTPSTPTAIQLEREISMMRVRLNPFEGEDTNNTQWTASNTTGVDYTKNSALLIYRLPNDMKIGSGADGGASATSTVANIISIADATNSVFRTSDPASSEYNPTDVIDTVHPMWRAVNVFPNNGGGRSGSAVGDADPAQRYFVVVSAMGKTGHILDNGTALAADQTIYWSGTVIGNFTPNVIREVSMKLKTGGTTVIPTTPTEQGGLEISVGVPLPWNSNVAVEDIDV